MANKVNYYSWIHELNKSAIMTKYMAEADLYRNSLNGFQISQNMKSYVNQFIDGARNKNHSGIMQRHNLNESSLEAKSIAEAPNFYQEVKLNENKDDLSDVDPKLYTNQVLRNFGQSRATTIKTAGGDPLAYRREKLAQMAAERAALAKKPDLRVTDLDGDGDADAFDVQLDAHDWKMGNENTTRLPYFAFARQEGIPTSQEHPAPRFGSKEEAEAFVREMNRRQRGENSLMTSLDDILDQQKTSRQGTMGEMQTIARILGGR
jgi:hypothetical protein